MADQNPSPKAQDHEPRRRCDAPHLSGTQFLREVMDDPSLPMKQRIKAAAELLKIYPDEDFIPRVKIIIPDCHDPISTAPGPAAKDGRLGSGSHFSPATPMPLDHSGESQGPCILRENTEPSNPDPLIDYSQPLSPTKIEEIKAAVHALCPDFDPSQPLDFYLCACGHWLTFPCDCCISNSRCKGMHRRRMN